MNVLGLSDHFVCGAAVVQDGELTAAINEERLVRKKMVMGFPWESVTEALRLGGVSAGELDYVAVASKWGHFLKEYVEMDQGIYAIEEGLVKDLFLSLGSHFAFLRRRLPFLERLYYDLRRPVFAQRRRTIRRVLREEYGITCPIHFLPHHYCHAATAYYASGFEDGLMITLDGAGDGHSSHVYEVSGGKWRHLHSVPSFDSVGDYYSYVTHICGFKAGKHEGKITGLAAYGQPSYREILDRLIRYERGSMRNIGNAFRHAAIAKLKDALPPDFDKADLAASIQDLTEDVASRYAAHWLGQTGKRDVGLAGGVFANVKVNQRIHEVEGADSVFIYPAMSDEGIAAGAALALCAREKPESMPPGRRCFQHVYLGPDFSERQISAALDAQEVEYVRSQTVESDIAQLISDGYVVARFSGRMEYGPRALGNRSILYRADDPTVNDWLNERLGRTEFMPFAPSTIAEDADVYYHGLDGARDAARFMTITFHCTDYMAATCPGVVHVDRTARPQLVSATDNPSYHRIISEFKRLTGCSTIVNTSFNIHEEPIVCTPEDAIRAFRQGHLDVLAIGPFVAKNPDADARVAASADVRSDRFS